jgi:hypothetical protein
MPQATVQASTSPDESALLIEMLRRRGLLAEGGNIRALPFGTGTQNGTNGNGASNSSNPVDASAMRPAGPTPVLADDNTLVDPTTGKHLDPQTSNDWLKYFAAGAGIAGGVAITDALRQRRQGSRIPLVEGEVIDPLGPLPNGIDSAIVNGEYTEVPDPKRLGAPSSAITDGTSPSQLEAAKAIAARRMATNPPAPVSDTSIIRGTDAMSDISPEEMAQAKAIAKQLVENRTKGNAQVARQNNIKRRYNLPTGPTDENSLLNTVIDIMRRAKIPPSAIVRAVP